MNEPGATPNDLSFGGGSAERLETFLGGIH
jgi:hypothetical protein